MGPMLVCKSESASGSRAQPQGLSQNIRSLDHGSNSGEIAVRLKAVANASSYELRYAAVGVDNGGTALTWTTEAVTGVKTPVTLTGLRPVTTDAFQVRSLGKSGYSDWSDSATLMCT